MGQATTATVTVTATTATATTSSPSSDPEELRSDYRGKCLYKTGKCNNERALKTTGQAHNLCDEHRSRQNEHQRKLDAKNRRSQHMKRSPVANRFAPYPIGNGMPSSHGPPPGLIMASDALGREVGVPHSGTRVMRLTPTAFHAQLNHTTAVISSSNDATTNATSTAPAPATATSASRPTTAPISEPVAGVMFQPMAVAPGGSTGTQMPIATATRGPATTTLGVNGEVLPTGVVYVPAPMPPAPPPPQMGPPAIGLPPDFDGIIVPLPSFLEGEARAELRTRVHQKVMDFIAEECMRRYNRSDQTRMHPLQSAQPPPAAAASSTNVGSSDHRHTLAATATAIRNAENIPRQVNQVSQPNGFSFDATTAPSAADPPSTPNTASTPEEKSPPRGSTK